MGVSIAVAQDLVDQLNADSFSLPFMAERHYLPGFDLKDLETLRVSVVPESRNKKVETRERNQSDIWIDVAIQQRLEGITPVYVDPLVELVEEIEDWCLRRRVATSFICFESENDPIFAPEHLKTKRMFTSLLSFGFRNAF